ncbi:MAG: phosphoribosylglycinamide formyltransferase [Acidimicrobiales bacterium]
MPGLFQTLAPVLDHYGYLAVAGFIFLEDFGTPFVPGETVLIGAAVYAGAGRLNVVAVALLGLLAAVLGDNVGYAIGHFVGREAIARWGRYVLLTDERMSRAEAFFARQGGKVVVAARFVDGLRQVNGIVAGMTEMPWLSFLAFNFIGAVAWVGCWVALGYMAGSHIVPIYNWFSRAGIYALVAVVVALAGVVVGRRLLRRRAQARADRASSGAGVGLEVVGQDRVSNLRLGVLASGSGTILESVLAAGLPVCVVLADRPCRALEIAARAGVPAELVLRESYGPEFDREGYTHKVVGTLRRHRVDVVAMAGFGTVLGPEVIRAFPGRVLNTHPALLPNFKGWHAVRDALAAGVAVTGTTVHIATEEADEGPVLAQEEVKVLPGDTEEALHERIKVVERRLYPETIRNFLEKLGQPQQRGEN